MTKMLLQEGHELSEPINSSVTQSCFAPGRVALERLLSTLSRGDEDTEFILQSIRLFEDVEQILRNQGYLNVGSHCLRLAVTLFDCYNTTGEDSLLTEAVNLGREALTRHPSDHPNRAACCGNVAVLLKTSYKVTHIDAFLVEAVILEREVLSLHPVGPEHVKSCGNLANSLAIWYESTRDHSILMKAIDLQRHALSSSPSGHPDYERSCENLSLILQLHYETSGATHILLEVIDLQRETISLRPPGHPNCAQAYLNLAISLKTYYNSSGDHSLLREAIDLERQALSLYPPDQPTRSRPLTNLALSLTISYESSGDVSHLLEAIELQRVSLSLRNAGHPDKASDCGNLAKSLITHYTSTGDDKLLMEAISLQRESLSLCHVDHPDHGLHCINLAGSLRTRYYNTGDDNLLMEAIDLQRESLSIHSTGHPSRDITCQNLAASLLLLYDNINDDLLLVEATTLLRESLSLCPPGHLDRGKSCLNLALSLKARHEKTGEDDLVTEAIDLEREALALHPPGHPGHAISCWNLANSLRIHYIQSANEHLLDEIHQCCTEGLSMDYPSRKWRNATMLAWLHMQTGSTRFDVHAAIQYLDQSLVNHSDSIIEATSLVMFCLKHLWEDSGDILEREHHIALTPVYRQLIKLLPFLTYPVLETRIQLKALRMASQIGSDVFVNSVLAENWTMGLEDLELAQGLMWSQRLHYRDPQLEDVPALLSQQLKDLLKGLALSSARTGDDRSASTVLTSRDLHHDQAAQVYLLLREIRALPGLDRFMLAETYSTLASVASVHPVVVLVGAHGRFYAVLLTSDTQNHALLPLDWRSEDFDGALAIMNSARSHRGAHSPPGESEEPSGEDIKRAAKIRKITPVTSSSRWLRLLWFKLVRPVLDRLGIKPAAGRARPRLHWCPTGKFSSLPLHAAGIYDGSADSQICCSDYIISSYTPTLAMLLRAQKAILPMSKESCRLALVAEKRAQEKHLQAIPQVDAEVENAAMVARENSIQTIRILGSTTVFDTRAAIQAVNMVHLACHGIQDTKEAIESGFCLGDGRLTISGLMELKTENAFLAFLSACETAKGDVDQPDQALHLAAAMLFAGFKSVIATMWAISDYDGPMVAKWFYEALFAKEVIDMDHIPYALDTAVTKLRQSGVSLDRWAPFIHMGA